MADHAFAETVAETTQVRAPWRTVVRTVFQGVVSFAALAPFLAQAITNGDLENQPVWLGAYLSISAVVTRIMAVPAVEKFLRDYIPFLAAGAKS